MRHYTKDQTEQDKIEAGTIWPELKRVKNDPKSKEYKAALDILFKQMP